MLTTNSVFLCECGAQCRVTFLVPQGFGMEQPLFLKHCHKGQAHQFLRVELFEELRHGQWVGWNLCHSHRKARHTSGECFETFGTLPRGAERLQGTGATRWNW